MITVKAILSFSNTVTKIKHILKTYICSDNTVVVRNIVHWCALDEILWADVALCHILHCTFPHHPFGVTRPHCSSRLAGGSYHKMMFIQSKKPNSYIMHCMKTSLMTCPTNKWTKAVFVRYSRLVHRLWSNIKLVTSEEGALSGLLLNLVLKLLQIGCSKWVIDNTCVVMSCCFEFL